MLGRGTVRSAALELFGYQWACLQPLMVWWDLWLVGCPGGNWGAGWALARLSEYTCRPICRVHEGGTALVPSCGFQWGAGASCQCRLAIYLCWASGGVCARA